MRESPVPEIRSVSEHHDLHLIPAVNGEERSGVSELDVMIPGAPRPGAVIRIAHRQ